MSRDRPFLGNGFQFPRLCNALRFLLGIGLVSAASLLGAAAPIPDTDGDGVPDGVERWLARAGAPVSPVISNVYANGDGDFIPDLVEIYLTRTSPTESDSSVCTGGGAPVDLTGQFDTRTAANLANPINVLTDEVSALSVCHTGTLLRVYSPRYGYADNTSLTGAGPYTFSATWNNGPGVLDDVAISGTCPLPCTAPNLVITGTTTTSGAARPTTLTRRTQLTYLITFEVNGPVFGAQVVVDPKPTNPSGSPMLLDLFFELVQMANGGSGGPSRLDHKNASLPGYFVPSVGTYFFAHYEVETIPTGLSSTETLTTYSRFSMTFTDSPSGGVGGMFRGVVDWIEDSNVNPTSVGLDTLYGKAQLPQTGGITRKDREGAAEALLYLPMFPYLPMLRLLLDPGPRQTRKTLTMTTTIVTRRTTSESWSSTGRGSRRLRTASRWAWPAMVVT
ncbi:MAG: hypothetical protein U5L03_16290 [Burkholderiaceae bacterium]|nr:hypothetical protein [Burkholderiaceae bacterium]